MSSVDLPVSIKLVFENKKLLTMNLLVTAYVLTLRKKKINIYECLFYYILSLTSFSEKAEPKYDKKEFQYNYFKIDKTLKELLIYLANSDLISLDSNSSKNLSEISIIVTDRGKKMVSDLQGPYFVDLKEKIKVSSTTLKYKKQYYKQFVGEVL